MCQTIVFDNKDHFNEVSFSYSIISISAVMGSLQNRVRA